MKILLISPPKMKTQDSPLIVFEEVPEYYPPLDLMSIAACLKKDYDVEILDAQVLNLSYEDIRQEIIAKFPNIIGIKTTIYTLLETIDVAKLIKEIDNSIHINLCGPHTHIFPEIINLPCIDSLIVGEEEIVFSQLVNSFHNLSQIKGIIYKENGQIIHSPSQEVIFNLDSLPYPAREMTPYKKYTINSNTIFTTILSSRGCPYDCLECHLPAFSKSFRTRNSVNVVNEIQECLKLGIQEFIFVDDVFTLNRKRVFELCDEIIRRNLKIKWRINARANNVDYSLVLKLKEAGCHWIHYEMTSGVQSMLDFLKKEITLKQIQYAIKVTQDVRITSSVDIILGLPAQTKEDVQATLRVVNKINPDFVNFLLNLPYIGPAGSKILMWTQETSLSHYYRHLNLFFDSNLEFPLHQNIDELITLLKLAYKKFYFRPGFFIKQSLTSHSYDVFKKRIKISFKVMGQ
ncbi:MAG: radical SAM protein [bacterium]